MQTLAELLSVECLIAVWTYPGTGQFEIRESFRCQKRPFGRIIIKKSVAPDFSSHGPLKDLWPGHYSNKWIRIPVTISRPGVVPRRKPSIGFFYPAEPLLNYRKDLQMMVRVVENQSESFFYELKIVHLGKIQEILERSGQRLSIASTQYKTYANDILAATTAVFAVGLPISKLTTCVCLSLPLLPVLSSAACGWQAPISKTLPGPLTQVLEAAHSAIEPSCYL